MSDNNNTVVGYMLPATITADWIRNACAVCGYSMMFATSGEDAATMLGRLIRAMGGPIVLSEKVDSRGASITTDEHGGSHVRQLVFRDEMEALSARTIKKLEHERDALRRERERLVKALSDISNAPPTIYDARNFRAIARDALTVGEK